MVYLPTQRIRNWVVVRRGGYLSADGDIDIYVDMPQTMLIEKLDLVRHDRTCSGRGVTAEVHWKDGDCPEVHLVYNDWISDEMQHRAGPDDLCLCQLNSVEFMCHKQARERMRVQYGPSWEIPLGGEAARLSLLGCDTPWSCVGKEAEN